MVRGTLKGISGLYQDLLSLVAPQSTQCCLYMCCYSGFISNHHQDFPGKGIHHKASLTYPGFL